MLPKIRFIIILFLQFLKYFGLYPFKNNKSAGQPALFECNLRAIKKYFSMNLPILLETNKKRLKYIFEPFLD